MAGRAFPVYSYPVHIGGLFRCCIQSLSKDDTVAAEGDERQCEHCKETVRLVDGNWKWQNRLSAGKENNNE